MELKLLSKLDVKANMAQISPKCENRRRSSDAKFQLSERKLKTWKSVKCLPSYRWESAKSRRAIQKSIYTKAKDMSLFNALFRDSYYLNRLMKTKRTFK